MDQAFDAGLEFYKRAELQHAGDGAAHAFAFANFGVAAVLEGAFLFFRKHSAVDNDVFICYIELDDPAANFLTNQLFHLGGVASATARGGHESPYANINAKAAFDDA